MKADCGSGAGEVASFSSTALLRIISQPEKQAGVSTARTEWAVRTNALSSSPGAMFTQVRDTTMAGRRARMELEGPLVVPRVR